MAIWLDIEGAEVIHLDEHNVKTLHYMMDTPDDSNARSTDVVNTIRLTGKITTAVDGHPDDDTIKIARWAQVRAEVADSYRKVTVTEFYADKIVRKYVMPQGFVVNYDERFNDVEGNGEFDLTIRQKKDLFDNTEITGNFEK
jgi:hypothetical protein